MVLALSLHAGPLGLVEPGQGTPNYDVQIPGAMFNNLAPSVLIEVLLKENPQYYFNFRKNESGAELFAYFDPVLPATQVIVTTRAFGSVLKEEPNFERSPPPVVLPCIYNCGPVTPPPVHPPNCIPYCHPAPPPTEVPEPKQWLFVFAGLVLLSYLRQSIKHHRG